MQINPVHQRTAKFALVTQHLVWRATAGFLRRTQITAGARIHGCDQLKPRRKFTAARRPRNRDRAALQWLAQSLKRSPGNFGQFVEKQNPVMGQRNFSWPGRRTAANQSHRTGGVMRVSCRALRPFVQRKPPAQTGHGGALQCLVGGHHGQQAGKTLRQHRLARTRRAHQQQTVPSGSGNLQCPFGTELAFDIGQIRVMRCQRHWHRLDAHPTRCGFSSRCVTLAEQEMLHNIEQMPGPVNLCTGHQSGFFGAIGWQNQLRYDLARMQGQTHGQRPTHRTQLTRE
ncbi:hypothetical protein GALL_520770 [mine drainage metagenome]|uniref:Uncharacterized protein n=1 Tax=mine drainage metagenome TaxID=410659 RepID=A0A1J5PM46_9ZZZZ